MSSVLTKKKRPIGKDRLVKPARLAAKAPARPLKESREEWLRQLRAEYTPAVSKQTLMVNEDFPVYDES
jgi:hypothetical protein